MKPTEGEDKMLERVNRVMVVKMGTWGVGYVAGPIQKYRAKGTVFNPRNIDQLGATEGRPSIHHGWICARSNDMDWINNLWG